ncbi:MAG: 2-hydroxyacyl-CoA dehydratase [Candidatus Margulisbacteria bacterium]|nr:2-hydroxyacyl-CoA dehydratase [Candidatus Margulisiibacteriota bacterium]MBU1021710.1 2-hydroxyacyl-CoA dehydratase [Candidatus Margulisiibacteriota bacterium]MBU1729456.1 2-hydroxyacyl-CoA dehydratase [Candidatus Margulisiibacteriota bacterium]MBU1955443.1 2-hydroxyacyl-CoA dehydratase [Candidatus Margulisiibacteriota bacterium]
MKRKIGITTTIPSEVIFASGAVPVDLNNVFVNFKGKGDVKTPADLIRIAEEDGLPRNICSWIKGIYGALKVNPDIQEVVVVVRGDCSNSVALADVLRSKKYKVIPFAYPDSKDGASFTQELNRFMKHFGVSRKEVDKKKAELDKIREKIFILDEMTWRENKVTGLENHLYLVSTSDFESDPPAFSEKVDHFLKKASYRKPYTEKVRLAYVGVPPIVSDLYAYVEELEGRVVYNEVQFQFSMCELTDDIVEQYLMYTYPYDVFGRVVDIKEEIEERQIDGVIHYLQSFCHHQIEDMILQKELPVPVLALECDQPGHLELRNKLRLEAFVNMLKEKK